MPWVGRLALVYQLIARISLLPTPNIITNIIPNIIANIITTHTVQNSGGWEEHTRGVGSRLMLAMGWQAGSGLGKAGGGRIDPVEARIYPQV